MHDRTHSFIGMASENYQFRWSKVSPAMKISWGSTPWIVLLFKSIMYRMAFSSIEIIILNKPWHWKVGGSISPAHALIPIRKRGDRLIHYTWDPRTVSDYRYRYCSLGLYTCCLGWLGPKTELDPTWKVRHLRGGLDKMDWIWSTAKTLRRPNINIPYNIEKGSYDL